MFFKINQKFLGNVFLFFCLLLVTTQMKAQPAMSLGLYGASPASGTQTAPASTTITYNINVGATVKFYLNTVLVSTVTQSTSGYFNYTYNNLPPGTNTFTVTATSSWNSSDTENMTYVVNNALPVPSINYISPTSGYYGQTFTGAGNASDPDGGTIQAYQWVCSGLGPISSTNTFSFNAILSPGTYTLTFYAQDNEGAWANTSTSITINNSLPTATISSVTPNPANWGASVSLSGSGSDPDGGAIQGYNWRSNISGQLSTAASFNVANLPPGTHTIYFKVKDNENTWSNEVSQTLTINNALSTASLGSITPSPANWGASVSFSGSGTDPDGGTIQAYNWRSSISGQLSTAASFSNTSLPPGTHTIYFKVQDNEGAWSNEVSTTLTINNALPVPSVNYISPTSGYYGQTFTGAGNASDPDGGTIQAYQWVCSGIGPISSINTFSFVANLSPGTYTLTFYAQDNEGAWANTSTSITINNSLPTASISSITPNPANWGASVSLSGSGSDPDGGAIQGYNWRSNISGQLSTSSSFSTSTLPPGTHTIYFKVQDNESAWSNEVSTTLTVNNVLPSATIGSITPSPANWGSSVSFSGSGTDPDGGTIEAYNWRSSINGQLSTSASFNSSSLSVGTHTIYFKVLDNEGAWSNEVSTTLTINNALPVPSINYISPYSGTYGQTFTGAGNASDPDGGTIQAYRWVSSINGVISNTNTYSYVLSVGTHTLTFNAQDNEGAWVSVTTTVTVNNALPTAAIGSITPNPANWGTEVTFNGSGSDPDGGTIQAYNWRSSIDGQLSTSATFSDNTLSPGTHTIYFKVKDNENEWSNEVSQTLTINNALPTATINSITPDFAVQGTNISFNGNGTDPDGGTIQAYNWRSSIDGQLNTSASFGNSTLSAGYHVIYFKVQDNEGDWSNETADLVTIYPPTSISIDTVQQAIGSGFGPLDIKVTVTYNQPGTITISFYSQAYDTETFEVTSAGTTTKVLTAPWPGNFTIHALLTTSYVTVDDFYNHTVENSLPWATINSISPNPADWNSNITFSGSGYDPDGGTIQGYNWRSSIDGQLSTSASFSDSTLSPGTHTIYFKVMDDENAWGDESSQSLTINNVLPTASITSISHDRALQGTTVTFSGSGTDPDGGAIQAYNWRSNIAGFLSDSASFSTSSLSVGNHVIFFKVQDNEGEWSNEIGDLVTIYPQTSIVIDTVKRAIGSGFGPLDLEVTLSYNQPGTINIAFYSSGYDSQTFEVTSAGTITKIMTAPSPGNYTIHASLTTPYVMVDDFANYTIGNEIPTAAINSISPTNAYLGDEISFSGSGNDPDGGTIQAHLWRSNIDDTISTTSSFTTTLLSAGTHTIYFKVKDDEGTWSADDTGSVTINIPLPQVTSFSINNGAETTTNNIVVLNNTATNSPTQSMASEDPNLPDTVWSGYSPSPYFEINQSNGYGLKVIYFKVKNQYGESNVASDNINYLPEPPAITSFLINNGSEHTLSANVDLNFTVSSQVPVTYYRASESPDFTGALWLPFMPAGTPVFELSAPYGNKTVYLQVKTDWGESVVTSDDILKAGIRIVNVTPPSGTTPAPDTVDLEFTTDAGTLNFFVDDLNTGGEGTGAGTYHYYFNNLDAGTHELKVSVLNENGTSADSISYIVNEKLLITNVEPQSPAVLPDTVKLYFIRNFGGVYKIFDNGVNLYTSGANSGSFVYDFVNLSVGEHTLKVASSNLADSVNYLVTDPPTVTIDSVTPPSAYVPEPDTITVSFTTNRIGSAKLFWTPDSLLSDSTAVDSMITNTGSNQFIVSGIEAGERNFIVTVTDSTGTGADSLLYTLNKKLQILVDEIDPPSPSAGPDTVKFYFQRNFSGLYKIYDNDSLITEDSAGIGKLVHNFTYLKTGDHLFKVVSGELSDSLLYNVILDRTRTISYKYDNLGNMTQIDVDSLFTFNYVYDTQSRLQQVNTTTPKGNEQTDAVYSYNTADQVDYFSLGSIGTIDYDYNKYRGWLKDVIHSGGMFTEYLRFSASGNIDTQKVHNVGDGTWGDYTYAFTYDNMNR
ncbi:MAG: hypothetical protein AB1521_16815, partial [Bacteroidota bacterium]